MADPAKTPREARPANQRGVARLAAVQALYQMELAGTDIADVVAEFEAFRLGNEIDGEQYRSADAGWFRDLVGGVVAEQRVTTLHITHSRSEAEQVSDCLFRMEGGQVKEV